MDRLQHADANYLLRKFQSHRQSLEGVPGRQNCRGYEGILSSWHKDKTQLDLNHAIECTLTVARNEWKYVAELETEFDPSLPRIACQPGEFNQVILNLIVNAPMPSPTLSEKTAQKREPSRCRLVTAGLAEIRIHDTGTGIPDSVRARVFDPFSPQGNRQGTGRAWPSPAPLWWINTVAPFTSRRQREGTTFVIRLPKEGKALTPGRDPHEAHLFVDDESRFSTASADALRRSGTLDMQFAVGGEAALQACEAGSFDIVISDMRMPAWMAPRCSVTSATVSRVQPHCALGLSDNGLSTRAVPVAHRFLAKPCNGRNCRRPSSACVSCRICCPRPNCAESLAPSVNCLRFPVRTIRFYKRSETRMLRYTRWRKSSGVTWVCLPRSCTW